MELTLKELLWMVRRSGGELALVGRERCNCEGIVRHNNGGNYHAECRVYWTGAHCWTGEFVVWWGTPERCFRATNDGSAGIVECADGGMNATRISNRMRWMCWSARSSNMSETVWRG